MYDLSDYIENKGTLIELQAVNDAFAVVRKSFDGRTGLEVEPDVQAIDIKTIDAEIAALQQQIDALQDVKKDLQAIGLAKEIKA